MSSVALRPLLRTGNTSPAAHLRPSTFNLSPSTTPIHPAQTRAANLIRRPKRPWLHPQIVILSDGSSYTQLTTSPKGIVRSTKDVRNHPMWNPTLHKLMDVEEDEAGKLRAFRERFGRGWDNKEVVEAAKEAERLLTGDHSSAAAAKEEADANATAAARVVEEDNLMDLISQGYDDMMQLGGRGTVKVKKQRAIQEEQKAKEAAAAKEASGGGKKK